MQSLLQSECVYLEKGGSPGSLFSSLSWALSGVMCLVGFFFPQRHPERGWALQWRALLDLKTRERNRI